MPYQSKYFLVAPSIVSTVVAYTVTSRKIKDCQEHWVSSERYYTGYEQKSD